MIMGSVTALQFIMLGHYIFPVVVCWLGNNVVETQQTISPFKVNQSAEPSRVFSHSLWSLRDTPTLSWWLTPVCV